MTRGGLLEHFRVAHHDCMYASPVIGEHRKLQNDCMDKVLMCVMMFILASLIRSFTDFSDFTIFSNLNLGV